MTGQAQRWSAEAIGTFFLVLVGPGAAAVNMYTSGAVSHVGVALSFCFVVIAMIFVCGPISGAHLNPAVTIGFWSAGRFDRKEVAPYIVAQLLGAIAAGGVIRLVVGDSAGAAATVPHVPVGSAFLVELLLSFVLMLVIFAVATDDRIAPGFAAIAIGLTVGFCALMGGPLTGASMNPARSFGPALASSVWSAHWVYWLAPILAMPPAVAVYRALRRTPPPEISEAGPVASTSASNF